VVYDVVRELLDQGVVSEWDQWKRGAVTPYKLHSLPRIIDQGMDLTYEEVVSLTEPRGSHHKDAPLIVASGLGGTKSYMLSASAKDNLREISVRMRSIGITDGIAPERGSDQESAEDLAHDLELGYLDIFFRSQFFADEIEPLWVIYSEKDESLEGFRTRTIERLLQALEQMSENLLEKMGKTGLPQRSYAFFFAAMLERYIRLASETRAPTDQTEKLKELKDKILARTGEAE
jgi:hypothetical protein